MSRIRRTDGDARMPPEMFAGLSGSVEVMLHIGATARYVEGLVECVTLDAARGLSA